MRWVVPLLAAALTLSATGCATTGPKINKEELRQAQEIYEVKAKRYAYRQLIHVRTVGEKLLLVVPEEVRPKSPKPAIGILLDELTLSTGRVFGVPGIEPDSKTRKGRRKRPWEDKKACLIAGVLPNSPAQRVGLQPGDLLVKVNQRSTPTPRKAAKAFKKLKPGDEVTLILEREGVRFDQKLVLGEKPYPVTFNVSDEQEVNAFASPGQIVVTSGLLRFAQSDSELSVVLGHELAHLTEGHYAKKMGTSVLAGIVGIAAGIAVDIVAPGAGGVISRVTAAGIRAPFSQDFEREADYVGLKYVYRADFDIDAGVAFWDRFATELPRSLSESFFNTHPTSPERLLRLEKTIKELKSSELKLPDAA